MADKRVNLIIALKDQVSAGMDKIKGSTNGLTSAFKALGAAAATYFSFRAIVGGLSSLAKAYAEQESANNKLAATFKAAGENGDFAVAKWGAWATSIQRVTTLGDEQIMGLVSLGKTMGIANSQLADATKGAIGLSKAFGIDLNSAMKMTALALQGEYTMLGRYIPELRSATSEAQKHAIVQQAMARGFIVAQEETKTLAGATKQLFDVFGDAKEVIGGAAVESGGAVSQINKLKDAIISLEENGSLNEWGENIGRVLSGVGKMAGFLGATLGKIAEGWTNIGVIYKNTMSGFGRLGANIVNPPKDAENMFDIIRRSFADSPDDKMFVGKAGEAQKKLLGSVSGSETSGAVDVNVVNADEISGGVKKTQGGFAELFKKMHVSGASPYEQQQFARFVAEQELAGASQGVSGAGRYAAELKSGGMSEYDVIQRVQDFIRAEMRGMAAGIQGAGAFAAQLGSMGASSYDIEQAISGMLSSEEIGSAVSQGLSDPLTKLIENSEKNNETLEDLLALSNERMGGVKN